MASSRCSFGDGVFDHMRDFEATRTRVVDVPKASSSRRRIKQTNEAVIRLDLEKKQAVRKADREHRTMLQYKTLLAESKTPLLLAQKEIASLQKELDGARKAVDAKAKERDAMERAAKFAKAETEKVAVSVLFATRLRRWLWSNFAASDRATVPPSSRAAMRARRAAASMACRRPTPKLQRRPTAFPSLRGRQRAYAPRESRGTPRTSS